MTDSKTLAGINLYALFGAIPNLVDLDENAKKLAQLDKPTSLAVNIKDVAYGALSFKNGGCSFIKADEKIKGNINMNCTAEQFNAVVKDNANPPLNLSIVLGVSFLKGPFTALTALLEKYLKADKNELKNNRAFFEKSTTLMLYVISEAVSAIANIDVIGKKSASRIPDGIISIDVDNGPSVYFEIKNHKFTTYKIKCKNPTAILNFDSLDTARKLFDGEEDAMTFIGSAKLKLSGSYLMIDNFNRILSRVALYLA